MSLYSLKREILSRLEGEYAGIDFNNTSPVMTRPLSVHNNIVLSGYFSTNDATLEGRPMYVTVLRRENSSVVHDGFGFAVMVGNETASSEVDYDKHNIFIVDNNILTDHIVFGGTTLTGGRVNQFLAAGKIKIQKNVSYNFEHIINENWSTELRIWQVGASRPVTPTLISGALSDGPLGLGGAQLQDPVTGEFTDIVIGREVGIGVKDPSGYSWRVGGFNIESKNTGIPIQIFEFQNSTLDREGVTGKLQLTYYGSGQSTSLDYEEDPLTGNIISGTVKVKGLDFYIAKFTGDSSARVQDPDTPWEYLGSNSAGHADSSESIRRFIGVSTLDASSYEFYGKVYIAVTKNLIPEAMVNEIDKKSLSIKTDYVELSAERVKKVVDRNCVDVWVDPINYITSETKTVITGASTEAFDPELLEPVYYVSSIATTLSPDYNLLNYGGMGGVTPTPVDNTVLYSNRMKTTLEFPEIHAYSELKIDYLRVNLDAIQSFVSTSNYRSPGTDVLVRAIPPVIFNIHSTYPLRYRGNISVEMVKETLVNYINGMGIYGIVSKSSILALLYSLGITYVDLTNFKIFISEFDFKEYWVKNFEITDQYELTSGLSRWYTRPEFLNITKLV